MKNIIVFFILIFIPTTVFTQDIDKKLHIDCIYPSIGIICPEFNSTGSAVVVRSEKINENLYFNIAIGCDHVFFMDGTEYYALSGVYKDWSTIDCIYKYKCKVIHKDKKYDLAIVSFLSDIKIPEAKIDLNSKPYIGQELIKVSSGQCLQDIFRLDYGKLTSPNIVLKGMVDNQPVYRSSIFCTPGDSGGPVYNSDYCLMGILNSMGTDSNEERVPNVSFILPIDFIVKMSQEQNNYLDFVYNKEKSIPKLPYIFSRLDLMEISN